MLTKACSEHHFRRKPGDKLTERRIQGNATRHPRWNRQMLLAYQRNSDVAYISYTIRHPSNIIKCNTEMGFLSLSQPLCMHLTFRILNAYTVSQATNAWQSSQGAHYEHSSSKSIFLIFMYFHVDKHDNHYLNTVQIQH